MRQVNKNGLDLIKTWEGCRLTVYLDVGNVPTVGYGHVTPMEVGQHITQDQADLLLHKDLIHVESCVEAVVHVPLTDNQFSACCALAFNIGTHNFGNSTLCEKLNAKDYIGASEEFEKWCKVKGKHCGRAPSPETR
jgi:lysozyme